MMFGSIIGLELVVVLIITLGSVGIFQRNTGNNAANNNNSLAVKTQKTTMLKAKFTKRS